MTEWRSLTGPLWFSYVEAVLTSLVVGFAENYFAAFALQQGLTPIESGLLTSLPLIFAAVMQFIMQTRLKQIGLSFFVKRALFIQSLSLLGLCFLSLVKTQYAFSFLFFFYAIYWLGHFSIQPAWNRWISDIIPFEQGQSYFSVRTRLSQIGILLGLFGGGALLHLNVFAISIEYLFLFLFLSCFVLKIAIIQLFRKHPAQNQPLFLNIDHIKNLWLKNINFFKSYALFNATLYLSAPFVAGYLLSVKGLSYLEFMYVMSGLFIGKVFMTYYLNHNSKQFEPHKILLYGGILAAPLPALWPFCTSVTLMFLVHFLSGLGWACWEVGMSLNFFKKIDQSKKIEVVSLYNYIGVLTQVLGTIVGALLFKHVLKSNFDILFIVAGIIRLMAVLGLRKPRLQV